MSLLKLFTSKGSELKKEDILNGIYWFKQFYALICGVLFGFVPIVGFVGIASFLVSVCFISYSIAYSIVRVTEDVIDSATTVITEGIFPAFTLFLLSWIITFSALHA
ncbi:hypothetical protein ABK040_009804 [Willaertia magna]